MIVKAIVIKADGDVVFGGFDTSLASLQKVVGGMIENINLADDLHCYINEEGKMLNLPMNPAATTVCEQLLALVGRGFIPGDWLAGDVIFLGEGEEGESGDVPAWFENLIEGWLEARDLRAYVDGKNA